MNVQTATAIELIRLQRENEQLKTEMQTLFEMLATEYIISNNLDGLYALEDARNKVLNAETTEPTEPNYPQF